MSGQPTASLPSRRLALRLAALMLLYGSVLGLIISLLLVQAVYRSDMRQLESTFDAIERSDLPGLAAAMWSIDPTRTRLAFDAITQQPGVGRLHLIDEMGGQARWQAPALRHVHASREFTLQHLEFEKPRTVGRLRIELTDDAIRSSRWQNAGMIVLATFGTLLLVACSFLLAFRRTVGRHLKSLAAAAADLDLDTLDTEVRLDRPRHRGSDELDALALSLNQMRERLKQQLTARQRLQSELEAHRQSLEKEVAARTNALAAESRRAQNALTDLKKAHSRLEQLARTDALTGLPNRRHLSELMAAERVRAQRARRTFSVLLADLDRFKAINDSHGHDGGDAVLREVARRMREALRAQDAAGRWGGEEFLVLLPEADAQGAQEVAEKLRRSVAAAAVSFESTPIPVSATIGAATWNGEESLDMLVARADRALYVGKQGGRDRVVSA